MLVLATRPVRSGFLGNLAAENVSYSLPTIAFLDTLSESYLFTLDFDLSYFFCYFYKGS